MSLLQDVFQTESPVALVTGSAAPRVGRVIALHLAAAGCRLAIHGNQSHELASSVVEQATKLSGQPAISVHGSLADDDIPGTLVQSVIERFGRIDILVNSAAIWGPKPLMDTTAQDLRENYQINAIGSFLCAQAAGQHMIQQESGGAIINIGEWATHRPYTDHAAYFPSKQAVESITRTLAVEFGLRNPRVRVNCVQPGPVMFGPNTTAEYRAEIASSTLVGRAGQPENVAHAVTFLCENDFVTGVCLPVDGGRSVYAPDGLQDRRRQSD